MKILIISDTHRKHENLLKVLERECPVDLLIHLGDACLLYTSERLEGVINQIRKIDFSVFYREVLFSDPDKGINLSLIHI